MYEECIFKPKRNVILIEEKRSFTVKRNVISMHLERVFNIIGT